MLFACLIWALNAAIVRSAGDELPTSVILFFRNGVAALVLIPLILRGGVRETLRVSRPVVQGLRIVLGLTAMACTFYAYRFMNIADATALSFLGPLFTMLLAALILREVPGWRRWCAAGVGFIGMLIMIRPGFVEIDFPVLVALSGAFFIGSVGIALKILTKTEGPLSMIFWFLAVSTAITAPFAAYSWVTPSGETLFWLIVLGATAVLGHLGDVRAYKSGEASLVAPFRYSILVWAALIGFLIFSEIPDVWKVVGAAIVASANIYIARREALKRT